MYSLFFEEWNCSGARYAAKNAAESLMVLAVFPFLDKTALGFAIASRIHLTLKMINNYPKMGLVLPRKGNLKSSKPI